MVIQAFLQIPISFVLFIFITEIKTITNHIETLPSFCAGPFEIWHFKSSKPHIPRIHLISYSHVTRDRHTTVFNPKTISIYISIYVNLKRKYATTKSHNHKSLAGRSHQIASKGTRQAVCTTRGSFCGDALRIRLYLV